MAAANPLNNGHNSATVIAGGPLLSSDFLSHSRRTSSGHSPIARLAKLAVLGRTPGSLED